MLGYPFWVPAPVAAETLPMANNIAVSVTADVADLTAKMAVAKTTMQDASRDMRASAQAVIAAGGWTTASAEIKTAALQSADAVARIKAEMASYAAQMRTASAGALANSP